MRVAGISCSSFTNASRAPGTLLVPVAYVLYMSCFLFSCSSLEYRLSSEKGRVQLFEVMGGPELLWLSSLT